MPGYRPEVLEVSEPLFLIIIYEITQRSKLLLLGLEPEPAGEREVARLASLHLTLYTSSRLPVITVILNLEALTLTLTAS